MWRIALIVVALLTVLFGTGQMDMRSGLSSDDGHHAALLNVVADLDCSGGEIADACSGGDRDCCIASHCVQCVVVMQPRLLQVGLRPLEESRTDFETARLSGRSVLPEKVPPKLS